MAFTSTLVSSGAYGDLVYRAYTYDCDVDTGGTITTDLGVLYGVSVSHSDDETYSVTPSDVTGASTVVLAGMTASSTGQMFAIGTVEDAAFSATIIKQGVYGDIRYVCYKYDCPPGITGGTITTQFSKLYGVKCAHKTDETITVTPTDVAKASTVVIGGATAGSIGYITVYGAY